MRFHRIENPNSIDEQELATLFDRGADVVILQFSKSTAYSDDLLRHVNQACERFGVRLNIRFYGHYGTEFNCRNLLHVPSVRSLNVDCLARVSHLEAISKLALVEEFAFDVFEADVPQLLEYDSLQQLRTLSLGGTRKKNIDLAPLASYGYLEELFLQHHHRHIDVLSSLGSLKKLSLSGMAKTQPLGFIRSIAGLRSLRYILGGREGVDELAHDTLERLEIVRVRGLSDVDVRYFPLLERLTIEDQLQIEKLDVSQLHELRRLSIFNCKNLSSLLGLEECRVLESLRVGMTALDPEAILDSLPTGLQGLSIFPYRKGKDRGFQKRIEALGLPPAFYTNAP